MLGAAVRPAPVNDIAPTGQLTGRDFMGGPTLPMMRPMLGGPRGGFHYSPDAAPDAPAQADTLVLAVGHAGFTHAVGYTASPNPADGVSLPSLAGPGDSGIFHKSGNSLVLSAGGLAMGVAGQDTTITAYTGGEVAFGASAPGATDGLYLFYTPPATGNTASAVRLVGPGAGQLGTVELRATTTVLTFGAGQSYQFTGDANAAYLKGPSGAIALQYNNGGGNLDMALYNVAGHNGFLGGVDGSQKPLARNGDQTTIVVSGTGYSGGIAASSVRWYATT